MVHRRPQKRTFGKCHSRAVTREYVKPTLRCPSKKQVGVGKRKCRNSWRVLGGKRKRDELILSLLQNISARIGTAGPTPSMTELGRTGLIGAMQEDFIETPSVYESKVPKTSSEEIVQNLRKAQPRARFGPCYWDLRDSVFIGRCKLKVENAGIGEFLNQQMHLNQNERMCGFLFDAEECWLIESFGLKCSRYKRVPWTAKGSLKEIRNLFQWNRGWHAITEMCRVLEVEIVEGEPYFGYGCTRTSLSSSTDWRPS